MPCVRWNCLLILFKDSKIATVKSTIVIYLILHNVLLVNHKIYYLYIVKYIYFYIYFMTALYLLGIQIDLLW